MPFIKKKLHDARQGFGADLKELRELRGFTREALARLTGIHALTIAALEEGQLENLTDPVYAERHVRALVKVLDGSPTFYLEKYRALLADLGIQEKTPVSLRPRVSRYDFVVSSRLVFLAGFSVLILLIGGYVVWQAKQMTSLPALEVTSPTEGLHLDRPSIQVTGSTDAAAKLTINGAPVIVGGDGRFSVDVDVPPGLSLIKVQSNRRYSAPVIIERHVFLERSVPSDIRSVSSTTETDNATSTTSTER
ncbi:helix-turn-helix domain-containing protein [Candidatus Uhrbacteria bacterium]|nr:helix-turn-helix domain-containing protein [Candidatus Uhrbacteria bacterium]